MTGILVVLEGSDGSGKATQLRLLRERLEAAGYDVAVFDFPRYDQESSYFVKQYLEGNYGPASEVSPYTASLFYALDRYEASPLIRQAISENKIVLCNRYAGSNMAHQGAKFSSEAEQRGFFLWEDSLEFQLMGIPRATQNVFLRLPVETSYRLIKQRAKADGRKLDQHEIDKDHLEKAIATFDLLCKLFPKDYTAIDCAPNKQLLSVAEISNLIWAEIKPLLPQPIHLGRSRVVSLDSPQSMPNKKTSQKLTAESRTDWNNSSVEIEVKNISLLLVRELAVVEGIGLESVLVWSKSKGDNGYVIPAKMNDKLNRKYKSFMNQLGQTYVRLESELTKKTIASNLLASNLRAALTPLVPMAATANIKIKANLSSLKLLAKSLNESSLPEAKRVIRSLPKDTAYKAPSERKELSHFLQKNLPPTIAAGSEAIEMVHNWPRNEFDLISEASFSRSDLSHEQISAEIDSWKYDQKLVALKMLIQANDPALTQTHYRISLLENQPLGDDLVSLGIARNLKLQPISARFGYSIPKLITESGLEDEFIKVFDDSLVLYSELQAAKITSQAAYACLKGHKSRLDFSISAFDIKQRLDDGDLSANQLKVLRLIITKIKDEHPIIGNTLFGELTKQLPIDVRHQNISKKTQSKNKNFRNHKKRLRKKS